MKICKLCGATSTCRWYSGPKCNRCHLRLFKKKNPLYFLKYRKEWQNRKANLLSLDPLLREEEAKKRHKNYIKHKEKIIKNKAIYQRKKLIIDDDFKLLRNLRARLNKAIKGNYKSGSAIKNLGCSISELKIYLESKFLSGMTWDNYGRDGWHIDHIVPLSSFNLQDTNELKKACHYTNLQPLWRIDNLVKSNKIVENNS